MSGCTSLLFSLLVTLTAASAPTEVRLSTRDAAVITAWFNEVGRRAGGEPFGQFVARIGLWQKGRPYYDPPPTTEPEVVTIRAEDFQCVSLIESSLALARCLERGAANTDCFVREIIASRYRDGTVAGFASRLHYFDEWLADNERRGRMRDVTAALGGKKVAPSSGYITTHPRRYQALTDPEVARALRNTETQLRAREVSVVDRAEIKRAQALIETGDIIAVVSTKPGLFISHVGLAYRDAAGTLRLLHASSHHRRVVVSAGSLADYILARPERKGVVVARPDI